MAADFVKFNTKFEVLGGYLSPVSDAYKKAGLASARHRYLSLSNFLLNLDVADKRARLNDSKG